MVEIWSDQVRFQQRWFGGKKRPWSRREDRRAVKSRAVDAQRV